MGFNWLDPLNLDQRGGIIGQLYPIINPVGAIKKNRDAAEEKAAADRDAAIKQATERGIISNMNGNGMKKGGKVKKAAKPAAKKETKARGIAKDTRPVKTFARGGGVEQRGKTKGRFV